MEFTSDYKDRTGEIIRLFAATFTDSEGPGEGALIEKLATDMIATVDEADLFVFSARDDAGAIIGAIIFTRIAYPEDDRTVFLLAPVAVATSHHGRGVGQGLLRYGLGVLRENGVDIALTYGDINFYGRVGFAQITDADAQPPLPLSYPEGWLGQSLTGRPFDPLTGPSRCVAALDSPDYW